ncbi:MAG: RHS repeat-associated core domain-containing protein [Candidatus Promineifilaceae bacterium]|nr:RHS repeat-associated core domain-containing protein [Candidatus Promineifilaceae bacterium]
MGNRLTENTHEESNTYTYDIANRLTSANGVSYTWDDNGNLLDDGASTYSYDHANRLAGVTHGSDTYSFAYNGMGDRLRQTVNGAPTEYTLDINRGLMQVLVDRDNTYLYGLTRIGEEQPLGWQYHLPDALGGVRQLTDPLATLTMTQSYEPFGSRRTSAGIASTNYHFAGEWADGTGLIHLRARYLDTDNGRFITRDPWAGNTQSPQSLNDWAYALNNPQRYLDPTGKFPIHCQQMGSSSEFHKCVLRHYNLRPADPNALGEAIVGTKGCYSGDLPYRAPGYLEGFGANIVVGLAGFETVYSFARMERASFPYVGGGLGDSSLGVGAFEYIGLVRGLRSDDRLADQYRGLALVGSEGLGIELDKFGIPIPLGASLGQTGFQSLKDPQLSGLSIYLGGSLAPDLIPVVDMSTGITFTFGFPLLDESFITPDGLSVHRAKLLVSILSGMNSPLRESPNTAVTLGRSFAAVTAMYYAGVYEEIKLFERKGSK